jgi:hypothetical protein
MEWTKLLLQQASHWVLQIYSQMFDLEILFFHEELKWLMKNKIKGVITKSPWNSSAGTWFAPSMYKNKRDW